VDLELASKAAIVTGGSRGIGRAVARTLALEGANVVIAARDPARLSRAATELGDETGRNVVAVSYNAADDNSVRGMVDTAIEALGGVDILVNAAAEPDLPPRPALAQIDDETFWSDINVKVMGYLRCIRQVAPHMAAQGGGRIISIGGQSAFSTGSTIGTVRNISIAAMTKNLAEELASDNIRLNVVHPGATTTERTANRSHTAGAGPDPAMARRSLLGRMVEASEVAYVVAFLASTKSIAVNGDAISVAGGRPGVVRY
jgi:NAD(P)-dependent dehydrogenase (short-subunit alcohol dehydrogenase family)